jgi:hypothetical protein
MTENDPAGATASTGEPSTSQPAEDPGYLTESGEAVADDGTVVPIIGGLPAADGSAWDIGAPADERGAGLAEELSGRPDQAGDEDTHSS